jgi:hypothetical protein
MTLQKPPKAARWLLEHFGSSPNNSALIGDLDERYLNGRSAGWYWRQSLATIAASFFNEVWSHKRLTFKAIVYGSGVFAASRLAFMETNELLSALASWSRWWRHGWITPGVQMTEALLIGILAGSVIARVCRESPKAMVFAYVVYFAGVQLAWLTWRIMTTTLMPPYRASLIYNAAFITVVSAGALLGGRIFRDRKEGGSSEFVYLRLS